ncbi:G-protein coupled receptor 179 isoform X1 [Cydia pomonella]|uniref:G-protein coupled receptor 179 isoform X1 n=1 Tax=Cydia pomonella TaxID=82600 RepID=UPI002ADE5166|nr:G-protein coupled receptor 179 isoform X1 [Cydia pomonella]XP_061707553.1 G-protein coupled receptor 179 isoform X1 [Cydia pomonella]
MRARWAAWAFAWCACAAAAPVESPPPGPLCDPLLLRHPPPRPSNVLEVESAAAQAARSLSELIETGGANESRAAALARSVLAAQFDPPPDAVALGAPQLRLGVLFVADPPRLIIFQQNNSAALQQFWKTLASAWNASNVVWSNAWYSCEREDRGWWSGAAAARGSGALRAAAALFRRMPVMPCEEAMYDRMSGPPACDPDTTDCEAFPASGSDFQNIEYRCKCRRGYWHEIGSGWLSGSAITETLRCAACGMGSGDEAQCDGEIFHATLLAVNLAGMLVCLVIGLIIFRKRKCKAVAMGMWTVLEVVLLGALLMYGSAATQYIKEPRWRCVAGAWLRELGFVACYGSVVLRLWVLLAEFRTRKAHRWTPRDSEVLRIVGAMLCGAICYLAAFTATAACEREGCTNAAWHHVTAGAELLLLAAGARIAYAARNANVPFQERGWLATALACEFFSGLAWRGAALAGAAPEQEPLAATARAQVSSGAALACVLAPRLWHGYRARSLAQEVSRRGPAEGFGVEGEEEPTSEEVRAELKRLYVQLEILRNKTLRRDNPHISKRRGGRKPPHRRFSLQKKGSREKALQARRGGKGKAGGSASVVEASEAGDASRTPEDSVCSNEGPSHYTDCDQT